MECVIIALNLVVVYTWNWILEFNRPQRLKLKEMILTCFSSWMTKTMCQNQLISQSCIYCFVSINCTQQHWYSIYCSIFQFILVFFFDLFLSFFLQIFMEKSKKFKVSEAEEEKSHWFCESQLVNIVQLAISCSCVWYYTIVETFSLLFFLKQQSKSDKMMIRTIIICSIICCCYLKKIHFCCTVKKHDAMTRIKSNKLRETSKRNHIQFLFHIATTQLGLKLNNVCTLSVIYI